MTPRSRRRFAGAILVVVSIAIAAFLAEGIVRFAAPQILSMPWPAVNGVRIGEPNARGRVAVRGQYDTRVRFNSQGFRSDFDFAINAPPQRTRIAVLGDSFVFGWGVDGQHSFPAQLEAVLRSGKHDTEVINAGIPGQSLGEKAIWYRDAVARFRPDIVLLELLVDDIDAENGVRAFEVVNGVAIPLVPSVTGANGGRRSRWYSLPLYGWLSEHSHAVVLLKRAVAAVVRRNELRHPLYGDFAPNDAMFVTQELPLIAAEIVWLNGTVRQNGGQLIVIALPLREMIYGPPEKAIDDRYAAINARVSEVCRLHGIRFADLRQHMKTAASTTRHELYYSGGDTHPNELGYSEFAIGTARLFTDRDFRPH